MAEDRTPPRIPKCSWKDSVYIILEESELISYIPEHRAFQATGAKTWKLTHRQSFAKILMPAAVLIGNNVRDLMACNWEALRRVFVVLTLILITFSWRMSSSGMWRRVALVRTDFCERTYCLHHQGRKLLLTLFRAHWFLPQWWWCYASPKRRFYQQRHGGTSGILLSHSRGILKSYIALTGQPLKRRRNVSPVRYGLDFYIPEDGILHSYLRETSKLA
jgi:hypothetical protein